MANALRVSALLVVVGSLVWAISSFVAAGPEKHEVRSSESTVEGHV